MTRPACLLFLAAAIPLTMAFGQPAGMQADESGNAAIHSLTVETGEFRSVRGDLYIELSDALGEVISAEIHPVTGRRMTLTFDSLPSGPRAVRIFHDENSNGRLDTNLLGIPREGYGFSNNPRSRLGVPAFEDRLFILRSDTTITITLVYW